MSVDLKSIEKKVVERFSTTIKEANLDDSSGIKLSIVIASISANIMTSYLEEYLNATSSDQATL